MSLKIEVGKTYVDGKGAKVRVVATDRKALAYHKGMPVLGLREENNGEAVYHYTADGLYTYKTDSITYPYRLVKEYVPPVTHKVDVVWYKTRDGEIDSVTKPVGVKLVTSSFEEVHRQTVEYTE